ncbi:MAG: NAD(P)/FAD-dependent oxidoreductase [Cystobacterineae bacterium]|nr:NAD(P)/FAD-dependent oxidoreductase [Cystobacterineae bacterium]
MKKKVIVIGGGIAGLSAGIYALRCGFEVTILEKHTMAGGHCTAWKRGGYLFEGGMHWLAGSGEGEALHSLWRTIGGLDDSVTVHYPEPFAEFDFQGTPIRLYRNVDATEQHLLKLSPADTREIKKFCNNIRKLSKLNMPITDLKGLHVTQKRRLPLFFFFSMLPVMRVMREYSKMSREEYASRFSHEGIAELIRSIPGAEQGIAMLFLTLGFMARGAAGFPEGGSLPFVQRVVNTFKALGGKIHYETCASQVLVDKASGEKAGVGKASGVLAAGKRFLADAVIVTADTMAMEHLFEALPPSPWFERMKKLTEPTMVTFVSLGIKADLKNYPKFYLFRLKKPMEVLERRYAYLGLPPALLSGRAAVQYLCRDTGTPFISERSPPFFISNNALQHQ